MSPKPKGDTKIFGAQKIKLPPTAPRTFRAVGVIFRQMSPKPKGDTKIFLQMKKSMSPEIKNKPRVGQIYRN
jgi:hypothetical protein